MARASALSRVAFEGALASIETCSLPFEAFTSFASNGSAAAIFSSSDAVRMKVGTA